MYHVCILGGTFYVSESVSDTIYVHIKFSGEFSVQMRACVVHMCVYIYIYTYMYIYIYTHTCIHIYAYYWFRRIASYA